MINYDDSRRDVSIETTPGPRTQSRLIIREPQISDSGNYTCSASNTEPASIYVFVSKGKKRLYWTCHLMVNIISIYIKWKFTWKWYSDIKCELGEYLDKNVRVHYGWRRTKKKIHLCDHQKKGTEGCLLKASFSKPTLFCSRFVTSWINSDSRRQAKVGSILQQMLFSFLKANDIADDAW